MSRSPADRFGTNGVGSLRYARCVPPSWSTNRAAPSCVLPPPEDCSGGSRGPVWETDPAMRDGEAEAAFADLWNAIPKRRADLPPGRRRPLAPDVAQLTAATSCRTFAWSAAGGPLQPVENEIEPEPELIAEVVAGLQDALDRHLGTVRLPELGERLAAPYDVPHLDRDAALLEMGQDHVATAADVDHQASARSPFVPAERRGLAVAPGAAVLLPTVYAVC